MIINNVPVMSDASDIINELKGQLTINEIDLLGSIKDTPDNVMISCPYHKDGQERRPSMGVSKKDGICHCFTCGKVATLPELVSFCFGHYKDIGGIWGWNWILKNFISISVESRKPLELDLARTSHHSKPIEYVSDEELDSYRYFHPYMYKRKLTDEIIELFDIGYDKTSQCITFPIRDELGRTLFIARRSVNTKFFNYPSGAEKPVYGLYEWSETNDGFNMRDSVIICESMLDALTCWVYGKRAVALNGLGNELQFKQLNSMPCRKFILATDMDGAGLKARVRLKQKLKGKLVSEYRWDVNVAKDINDMTEEYFNNLQEVW